MQADDSNLQPRMGHSTLQQSTTPTTPQKPSSSRTNIPANVAGSSSKPKTKGKNRSKNAPKSPSATGNEGKQSIARIQSVVGARPISTPTAAAFAGPTFHASPAPSSLPIPSIFSKSVPESPSPQNVKAHKEDSSSSGSDSSTPPSMKISVAKPSREESPLDLFFKADREEKARARSASSISGSGTASGPFPPPSGSPRIVSSTPTGSQGRKGPGHHASGSGSGMFSIELDGNSSPGKPYGPAFSTPYSERINAARSAASVQHLHQGRQAPQQSKSDALKAYLFSQQPSSGRSVKAVDASRGFSPTPLQTGTAHRNANLPGVGPPNTEPPHRGQAQYTPYSSHSVTVHNTPSAARSSGLRQEMGFTPTKSTAASPGHQRPYPPNPSTPSRPSRDGSRSVSYSLNSNADTSTVPPPFATSTGATPGSTDLRGMEDSLRRLLKLEPSGGSDAQANGIGSAPSPNKSVPI
ncbi:MAG: hypothetical protein M1818_000297 [Claussenomyces sp. TS43310]|nr:MAG: hypothetical protein M1818_000297 [Claussenomyces sp. TS43310]